MYSVCLNIAGKLCVIVGGGAVAERKVKGLLTAGARVKVISPKATPGIETLSRARKCQWLPRAYAHGDLDGAFLVFAATDSPVVQQKVLRDTDELGILVNIIDNPDQCSFQVPATVQRGDLTLAVSTAGTSPAVAAMIRHRLEEQYGPEYGQLLQLMKELRAQVIDLGESSAQRKILFQNILHEDIVTWIRGGRWDLVQRHLQEVLGSDMEIDVSRLERYL